jgi:hypothetical protein
MNLFSGRITIFLPFSSEEAPPTLPMQMRKHPELTSFFQFRISVKSVTSKNLQIQAIFPIWALAELFIVNTFTITAISCEV